jgi:hypothetical protein
LLKVIEDLKSDERLNSLSEAQVKQAIILPILRGLGWIPEEPYEVWPEYSLEDRKQVDYALLTDNTPKVFIEVKVEGKQLKRYYVQLQDYVSKDDYVEIATLTNGTTWWFYLPPRAGNRELRKFGTVELDKQDKEEIAQKLVDFLGKENVSSGKAVQNAEALSATLPEVEIDHSDLSDVPAHFKDIAKKYGFKVMRFRPTRVEAIDQGGDTIFHIETALGELRLNHSKVADFKEFELIPPPLNAKYPVLKVDDPRAPEALQKHIDLSEYEEVK